MAALDPRWSGLVNRDTVTAMLKRAGDETDPVERGLLLAEAQVLATLDVDARLESMQEVLTEGFALLDDKLALLYVTM